MKRRWIAVAASLLFVSCGMVRHEVEYTLEPDGVQFPATVSPTDPLPIAVSVAVGGCRSFKRFEAQRTANTLIVRVVGLEIVPGLGSACTTEITYQTHTYTDPGTPARTTPFEIIVNGKSWGKVNVQ